MGPKIAFIGAGSFIFARTIITDLMCFPELRDVRLSLMDVDRERLAVSENLARQVIAQVKAPATVTATTDRHAALEGADYVVAMFEPDGLAARKTEIEAPLTFGVPQCVGDTLGPGGIFKGIRTATVLLDVARDMERLCPDALLMNYVNPMAINCWAVNRLTKIRCIGMCHGYARSMQRLAHYLGIEGELEGKGAGINHMCWILGLWHEGRDVYPELWAKIDEVLPDDPIRFSIMKTFGYFVTESPYHMAEYVPYFTKRFAPLKVHAAAAPELNYGLFGWGGRTVQPSEGSGGRLEQKLPIAWDIQLYEGQHQATYERQMEAIRRGDPVELKLSIEYAARIIHSLVTDTPRRISLNSPNRGLISNLTAGCTVEVPTYIDRKGVHPEGIGELPFRCAALCQRNVDVQWHVVEALATRERRNILYALLMDPLTGACLEPLKIAELFEAMVKAEPQRLPEWMV